MLSFECIKNEKSVYFLLTSAKTVPRGKEATHSPHSKWRRKLFYEECNTKNISINAGYINDSYK